MEQIQDELIRLNKYIAETGYCSRREADRLIESGRVNVDGIQAVQGMKIHKDQSVMIDQKMISTKDEKVYLAFYKPRGIVCTSEKREKNNIIDYLHYPVRITYSGRLDKESEGLMIMTNDGDMIQRMMRAANRHEKEYIVSLDRPITQMFIDSMKKGVYLPELDVTTRRCSVEILNETSFRIILTQGLNRQIRRMCDELGYKVMKLKRVRIMNIRLEPLKVGCHRELTQDELKILKKSLQIESADMELSS